MPRDSFGISFGSDQNDAPQWRMLKRKSNDRNSNENLNNQNSVSRTERFDSFDYKLTMNDDDTNLLLKTFMILPKNFLLANQYPQQNKLSRLYTTEPNRTNLVVY